MAVVPDENPPTFEESIELNQPMSPSEATEKLAIFHNTSDEAVLAAFRNLRGFKRTVEFTNTVNNSTPCISMKGKHPDGKFAWHRYINKSTGQPMMHVG